MRIVNKDIADKPRYANFQEQVSSALICPRYGEAKGSVWLAPAVIFYYLAVVVAICGRGAFVLCGRAAYAKSGRICSRLFSIGLGCEIGNFIRIGADRLRKFESTLRRNGSRWISVNK